jgi:inner membrane protein
MHIGDMHDFHFRQTAHLIKDVADSQQFYYGIMFPCWKQGDTSSGANKRREVNILDNITHGLLGVALGMLRKSDEPASPTDRGVVWATLLAAEIPDVDVFFGRGAMSGFTYHRGITHAVVMAPVVALLATGIVKIFFRKAKFYTLYLWSLLAVLVAHLLNDYMTGWGTRLLLPFSQARLALDWIPIVDLLYTVPLGVAVVLAWRRPALRRRAAATVVAYLAVYTFGYRGATHFLAEQAVAKHYAGQFVSQSRVSPNMFNPLAWDFTVDLGDRFEQGHLYPLGQAIPTAVLPKMPEDAVIKAVRSAPELRSYFAQFPFARITYEKRGNGYAVSLGDVRYQMAGRGMTYGVLLNGERQVTEIAAGGF